MSKEELVKAGVKGGLTAVGTWIVSHRNVLFPVAVESCNGVAIFFAVKNSRFIMEKIEDGKVALSMESDPDTRKKIYLSILRDVAPKAAPILGFYVGGMALLIAYKKDNDKQIADLTAALTMSQNALTAYQIWKQEAKKELPPEKVDEINKKVTDEAIKKNPQTVENTKGSATTSIPGVPDLFVWYDGNNNRYLVSKHGPNDLRQWVIEQNADLNDGRVRGNRVNINAVYEFLSDEMPQSYVIQGLYNDKDSYWVRTRDDAHHRVQIVDMDICTTEGPDQKPVNAFHCNFLPYTDEDLDEYGNRYEAY